jgi:hypothetical protein
MLQLGKNQKKQSVYIVKLTVYPMQESKKTETITGTTLIKSLMYLGNSSHESMMELKIV